MWHTWPPFLILKLTRFQLQSKSDQKISSRKTFAVLALGSTNNRSRKPTSPWKRIYNGSRSWLVLIFLPQPTSCHILSDEGHNHNFTLSVCHAKQWAERRRLLSPGKATAIAFERRKKQRIKVTTILKWSRRHRRTTKKESEDKAKGRKWN